MGKNVKTNRKIGRGILVWLLSVIVVGFVGSFFSTTDESGNIVAPEWYSIAMLSLPIISAVFYDKIKWKSIPGAVRNFVAKTDLKMASKEPDVFVVPRTKGGQEKLAEDLLASVEVSVSLANKSEYVSLFTDWYDEAVDGFSKLAQLDKVKFKGSPSYDCYRLKNEFQLHLCDAIVRSKERTISDIHGKYKNSIEFQRKALDSFEKDVNSVRSRFSQDTAALADDSIAEIREMVGLSPSSKAQLDDSISSIDYMDGATFETWCAGLLKKNGFENVKLTPSSGDQGVDILAEKDGIRYAVQCKCYSSDLGNTPVQEVNTGKSMPQYRCQIGVVMTNRYFTKGAKEAADAAGVLLWDRDKLQQMIKQADT